MKQYIYRLHGGGDAAEVYYYANGGYDNLPYKKMIKTVGGTGGSFKDDYQEFQIDNSRKYIVSSWMKSNRIESGMAPYALDLNRFADNAYRLGGNINLTTEWQKIYWIYNSGVDHAGSYISRGIVYVDNDLPLSVYWSGFQVEDVTGTDQVLPTSNFSGFIDEPKIYNYTRTSEEIKQDYNAGLAAMSTPKGSSVAIGGDSPAWMSDGLVGHWKMDEASWNGTVGEVIDSSGNGNNGTAAGTALTTTGKFGSGGGFDGESGTYVSLPDNMTDLSGDWAVGGWVKPNSDSNPRIFTLITDSDNLEVGYMSGSLAPYIRIDESTQLASSGLSAGQWQYIIYQMKSGVREIYLNGEKLSLSSGGITTNGMYSAIGGGYDNYQMNGLLDDFRFYSRSLSPEEVKGLYEYAPGPVLHLKMDEKSGTMAYDTSGNENHGNLINEPTWTEGKYGGGLEFDGVDDYLNINNSSQFDSSFSASAWIKVDSNQSSRVGVIGNAEYTDGGWFIGLDYDGYSTKFVLNDDSNEYLITGTEDIRNNWAYISLVFDGNEMFAYLNGKLIDSRSANITKNSNDLFVGRGTQGGWDNFFNGSLDDLKIYNYARTEKQIVEDMNAGHPIGGSPVGSQVAYWKFNEGYGTTAYDSITASGNDGTIFGASWTNDGKFGKALSFDGTDDYVDISSSTLGATAVSLWVKSTQSGVRQSIASGLIDNYIIYFDTSGKIGSGTTNTSGVATQSSGFDDGDWHHLYIQKNNTNDYTIYIDGINESGGSSSGYRLTNKTMIAASEPNLPFEGQIDEVKIYNYALSEEEVKKDYNQGKSLVLGSLGTASDGSTSSNSASRAYCIPGDTSTCNPPIGEWKFDEMSGGYAEDTSGNENRGTISGTNWEPRGKKGSALNFDGSDGDDHVDVSNFTVTDNPYTFEAWIKPTFQNGGDDECIVGKNRGASTGNSYGLGMKLFDSYLYGIAANNNSEWRTNLRYDLSSYENQWTHVVFTIGGISGTQTGRLFVNGALVDEHEGTAGYYSVYPFIIGNGKSSIYEGEFNGFIDDVRVYDYVRAPAQIAWDYNRGKPVGWWKMDEGEGTTVYDHSGNGNNGTMTNMSSDDWVSGKINTALDFDGGDDYVDCGDFQDLGNSFSIALWVNPDSYSSYTPLVFRDGNTTNNLGLRFDGSGNVEFRQYGGSEIRTDESFSSDNWYHVVAVSDNLSGSVYVNGELKKQGVFPNNFSDVGNISIGRYNYSTGSFIDGLIDDVRIYNYALTPLQVKEVYNGGAVNYRD